MTKQYDLIAIGTGTGASSAASRCRAAGWKVAVIDHLPFGGTYALRGCDPKKVLVGAAEAIDHSRRMRGKGLAGGEPAIAWNELIEFKRTFTGPVPAMKERSFAKNGIDVYHGRAKFRGPRSVEVVGEVLEGRGSEDHDVRRVSDRGLRHRLHGLKQREKQVSQPEERTMQGMMDGMMGGGMMWGMGLYWLLGLAVLVLAAGALIKYLFFSGRGK